MIDQSVRLELQFNTADNTISNAQIVAALGAELSFRLRAYFWRKYDYASLGYDSIIVTKV